MSAMPSVWGRHSNALFVPVVHRDTLLTVVRGEPDEWKPRLNNLGFKSIDGVWVKMGGMVQAEFQYLSPDIDLIGFRQDEVVDQPPDSVSSGARFVPFDLRDAILGLWQRQYDSLRVAFDLEHGKAVSRGQLWTCIESALDGEDTPETETLFGLAFEKLKHSGVVSQDAERFIGAAKIDSEPSAVVGRVMMVEGESIEWAMLDGVMREGRLAQKLRSTDLGCWAYDNKPRWAGGYPVVSPIWVSRDRLYFNDLTPGWFDPEDLLRPVGTPTESVVEPLLPAPVELKTLAISGEYQARQPVDDSLHDLLIETTPAQERFFSQLGNNNSVIRGVFPSAGWEDHADELVDQYAVRWDIPESDKLSFVPWLREVEEKLKTLSDAYYPEEPLRFVLSTRLYSEEGRSDYRPFMLVVAAVTTDTGNSIGLSGVSRHDADDDVFAKAVDLGVFRAGAIARRVDSWIQTRSALLSESAKNVAEIAGASVPVIPISRLSKLSGAWGSVVDAYKGEFDASKLFRLIATLERSDSFSASLRAVTMDKSLGEQFFVEEDSTNGMYGVDLEHADFSYYTAEEIVGWFNEPGAQREAIDYSLNAVKVDLFEAVFSIDRAQDMTVPGASKLVREPGAGGRFIHESRVFYKELDKAVDSYLSVITHLKDVIKFPGAALRLDALAKMGINYHLYERAQLVPSKLRAMPDEVLGQRIAAELLRKVPKANEAGETYLAKIVAHLMAEIRADGVQAHRVCFTRSAMMRRTVEMELPLVAQSRDSYLGGELAKWKDSGKRGSYAFIDSIAIADPELVELLSGANAPALKLATAGQGEGVYEDTGVVAGWAIKDIRGVPRDELLSNARQMSDQQLAKYITREMIWPRKSFEEMREAGVELPVAYCYDLIWKTLPRAPKSTSWQHVEAFVVVLSAFRSIESMLDLPFADTLKDGSTDKHGFARLIGHHTMQLYNDVPFHAKAVYRNGDFKVRGMRGNYVNRFDVDSYELRKLLPSLTWGDVIKSKRASTSTSGSRVQRNSVERVGPDYRNDVSVTGDDFIKTFGFSGVEFGNWTNQKEREKHMNFAYDSLMDFAKKMGWEPLTLSLGGKLGLCIGSRGRGGKSAAIAHFEPVNMAINLTRMSGDGSLAHEYFHAVAAHYGRLYNGAVNDVTNAFAYPLRKTRYEYGIPDSGGLREPLMTSFYNLMVAIMRAPNEGDLPVNSIGIREYTEPSKMLIASLDMDAKRSSPYWSTPAEMFARAMEIWFKDALAEAGERNDYLVRADKDVGSDGHYPNEEHMARINQFIGPWLDSISSEVKAITHPYLGDVKLPVLCSDLKSATPLSPDQLTRLACSELDRLFSKYAPNLMLVDDPEYKAGMYDMSRKLLMLNSAYADVGTFYHEAWHVANDKLLSREEQDHLSEVFAPGGVLAERVKLALLDEGESIVSVQSILSSADEVQAYAFQLWNDGKFSFAAQDGRGSGASFSKVKGFVDDVVDVGQMLGFEKAERLFEQFMSGELLQRKLDQDDVAEVAMDEQPVAIVWNVDEPQQKPQRTFGMRF